MGPEQGRYNEWVTLSAKEFGAVVESFRALLVELRCSAPKCGTWLKLSSRVATSDLRCGCGAIRFNLQKA